MTEKRSTADAHLMILEAKRLRHAGKQIEYANAMEDAAENELAIVRKVERGMGGELVPHGQNQYGHAMALKDPDHVNMNASIDRINLIDKSGVFDMAMDAAETVGARNAPEQMLAHQMAVAHRAALELLMKAGNMKDPVEQCRLSNTAARLMETYQKAMLTMQKMHTGGQQFVTVQHVQVKDGGQAIINGVGVTPEGGTGRK